MAVVAGVGAAAAGAGAAVAAAPAIAATAALIASASVAASIFKSGCREGIEMYEKYRCKQAGWFDFQCAMVNTYAVSNCGGLFASGATVAVASAGLLADKDVLELWKKFRNLGLEELKPK